MTHQGSFLRTFLFYVGFWLSVLFFGTLALLSMPFPYCCRAFVVELWCHTVLWWLKITCRLRYKIIGKERLRERSCVILSKHSSIWETIALPMFFHMPAVVAKRSLRRIPFYGWMLAACEPITINRKKGSSAMKQVMKQGKARLEKGRSILIFPEGTRVSPARQSEYKMGGVLLSKKNHRPILPVSHDAGDYWSDQAFNIKPGTITVIVGETITPDKKSLEVLNNEVKDWIESTLKTIKASAGRQQSK